jgi:hypothetical protein
MLGGLTLIIRRGSKVVRRLLAFSAALLALACSSYQPPQPRVVAKATVIPVPAEAVWQEVIRYFAEKNLPIENLDHSSFFVKTKPVDLTVSFAAPQFGGKKIPLKNDWCDCGEATIGNVWSSAHRILFTFNIVLRARTANETDATINVFFDGAKLGRRNLYAGGYDVEMPLQCISTGYLEQDLLRYLREASARH